MPLINQFHIEFRTEYICLRCQQIYDEPKNKCPRCNGPVCPRIIRTKAR
jgi:rRNA maturation endonuclease Nob1